jgi:hypothetical protein
MPFSETYPVIPNVRNPQFYSPFQAVSTDDAYGSAITIQGSIETKSNLKKGTRTIMWRALIGKPMMVKASFLIIGYHNFLLCWFHKHCVWS